MGKLYLLLFTRLTALCPGLPGYAGTYRKVKPIWILLKQETVSGSGISWATCKSAPRQRLITTPAPTAQFFTGRMPFLPPNQQRQSTEGNCWHRCGRNYATVTLSIREYVVLRYKSVEAVTCSPGGSGRRLGLGGRVRHVHDPRDRARHHVLVRRLPAGPGRLLRELA